MGKNDPTSQEAFFFHDPPRRDGDGTASTAAGKIRDGKNNALCESVGKSVLGIMTWKGLEGVGLRMVPRWLAKHHLQSLQQDCLSNTVNPSQGQVLGALGPHHRLQFVDVPTCFS